MTRLLPDLRVAFRRLTRERAFTPVQELESYRRDTPSLGQFAGYIEAAANLTLALVTLLATLVPARRAATLDPVTTLRQG